MPHFFIKKEQINNNSIELSDNDDNFYHLTKAMRVKINENIKFIDENKNVYFAKITEITKKILKAAIINTEQSKRFLKHNLSLVQSILAPDSQNTLISNAVQTGVKTIYPVISDNCSVKISQANRIEKWQKIAFETFKQCERADFAKIFEPSYLKETLSKFKKENIIIFAEKYENILLSSCLDKIDKNEEIAIVIGPEGGFSKEEFNYFKENNFNLVSLGFMIYKAQNAVVAGISNVVSRIE